LAEAIETKLSAKGNAMNGDKGATMFLRTDGGLE